MAIYIRPADTRSGPTLMGQILPGLINYRVGYGLKKNLTRVRDFAKTRPEPEPNPFIYMLKILKYPHIYIYIYMYVCII